MNALIIAAPGAGTTSQLLKALGAEPVRVEHIDFDQIDPGKADLKAPFQNIGPTDKSCLIISTNQAVHDWNLVVSMVLEDRMIKGQLLPKDCAIIVLADPATSQALNKTRYFNRLIDYVIDLSHQPTQGLNEHLALDREQIFKSIATQAAYPEASPLTSRSVARPNASLSEWAQMNSKAHRDFGSQDLT